jgi:hypothetical protein
LSSVKEILGKLDKYFELAEDDALELYDALDTLYNELRSKYLEALVEPEKNRELTTRILDLAKTLLVKSEKSLEEELVLIALLDILATNIHDQYIGLITPESREIKEESRNKSGEE